jgi:carbonic anhydrase
VLRKDFRMRLELVTLAIGVSGLLVSGCGANRHWYLEGEHHEHSTHWSYEGESGPEHWGDLDPAYRVAKTGQRQSPIDIVPSDTATNELPPLIFHYSPASVSFVNNGHTFQHDETTGSWLEVGGKRYRLKQFHFHVPSEHTIDGRRYAMEVHLVHEDAAGKVAVVAILADSGRVHPLITQLHENLPEEGKTSSTRETLDPTDLLPADHTYYRYDGSFTTPPCTEGVQWLVLRESAEVSAQNVDDLRKMVGENNRPIQPLHGRTIDVGGG